MQNVQGMTHLCLVLNHAILLLPHADLGNLVLPERSLFLQLRAPEGLDGIHGGTQLALLNLRIAPQHLVLTQDLGDENKIRKESKVNSVYGQIKLARQI